MKGGGEVIRVSPDDNVGIQSWQIVNIDFGELEKTSVDDGEPR